MDRLMSDLIVRHGMTLYRDEIIPLLPRCDVMTPQEFAKVLMDAEGLVPNMIGTKPHLEQLELVRSIIASHFGDESIRTDEIRIWARK